MLYSKQQFVCSEVTLRSGCIGFWDTYVIARAPIGWTVLTYSSFCIVQMFEGCPAVKGDRWRVTGPPIRVIPRIFWSLVRNEQSSCFSVR